MLLTQFRVHFVRKWTCAITTSRWDGHDKNEIDQSPPVIDNQSINMWSTVKPQQPTVRKASAVWTSDEVGQLWTQAEDEPSHTETNSRSQSHTRLSHSNRPLPSVGALFLFPLWFEGLKKFRSKFSSVKMTCITSLHRNLQKLRVHGRTLRSPWSQNLVFCQ